MNCTHPVIYMIDGAPTCHVCGAVLPVHYPEGKTIDLPQIDETKLAEPPKPMKKGKKTNAD